MRRMQNDARVTQSCLQGAEQIFLLLMMKASLDFSQAQVSEEVIEYLEEMDLILMY